MSFGKRLRKARKDKKLLQSEVAEILGIDDTTISKYENDKSEPDNNTINELATLYGVSVDWLHGRNKKENEFSLPESVYDHVIREAEEKYGVNLREDPVVNATLRELILNLAKMKQGNQ